MDIRELRIGSHVLYEGERVKIDQISQFGNIGLVDIAHTLVSPKDLSPIPITEELLKELGFEEDEEPEDGWDYGIEKVFSKEYDAPIECEYPCVSVAQYQRGLYHLQVEGTTAYVRDLHTLQNFVFMTTKKELI